MGWRRGEGWKELDPKRRRSARKLKQENPMLSISKVWLQFLGDFASQNLGPIRQLVQFSMATSETNSSEKLVDTAVWLTRRICLRSKNTIFWSRTFLTISVSHKYLGFDKAESSRILFLWGECDFLIPKYFYEWNHLKFLGQHLVKVVNVANASTPPTSEYVYCVPRIHLRQNPSCFLTFGRGKTRH